MSTGSVGLTRVAGVLPVVGLVSMLSFFGVLPTRRAAATSATRPILLIHFLVDSTGFVVHRRMDAVRGTWVVLPRRSRDWGLAEGLLPSAVRCCGCQVGHSDLVTASPL